MIFLRVMILIKLFKRTEALQGARRMAHSVHHQGIRRVRLAKQRIVNPKFKAIKDDSI